MASPRPLNPGEPIRKSARPSLLKSLAVATANPVWAAGLAPRKIAPATVLVGALVAFGFPIWLSEIWLTPPMMAPSAARLMAP